MPVYSSLQDIPEGEVIDTALRTGSELQAPIGGNDMAKVEDNERGQYTTKKADKTGIYIGPSKDSRYFKAGTPLPPGYNFSHERGAGVAADAEAEPAARAKNAKGAPENRATE